ncbi:unnamed protein product [Urochloa humidicola]
MRRPHAKQSGATIAAPTGERRRSKYRRARIGEQICLLVCLTSYQRHIRRTELARQRRDKGVISLHIAGARQWRSAARRGAAALLSTVLVTK